MFVALVRTEQTETLMAASEKIELGQVCQSLGSCSGVQVYTNILPVQALEALDFLSVGQR